MFARNDTLQSRVYAILKDMQWHCRGHEYTNVPSGQLAGGGGIQGLKRGTRSRAGLVIVSELRFCDVCAKKNTFDRWTGERKEANAASGIPKPLLMQILSHLRHTDVIEQRQRQSHELIVDHRFPMERWGKAEASHPKILSEEEIDAKFQLLKKDASGNHNLLKSRACELCIKTGKRGTPLGIKFFYHGDEDWPRSVPHRGPKAERGCVGCGWYNFAHWRDALNKAFSS